MKVHSSFTVYWEILKQKEEEEKYKAVGPETDWGAQG